MSPLPSPSTTVETSHELTLYPSTVTVLDRYNFPLTNTVITGWVGLLIIIILSLAIRFGSRLVPTRFQSFFEMIWEWFLDTADQITGSRELSNQFLPFVLCVFFFILIQNLIGLLPGIGTIYVNHAALLRGATTDVNLTLGLGIVSVVVSFCVGLIYVGGWHSINRFLNLKAITDFRYIFKKPMVLMIVPILLAVGALELVAEFVKILSLTFRLYGNVYAGEVLIHTIGQMARYGVPAIFMLFETMIALIQAGVFALLTLVGMSIAATFHAHGAVEEEEEVSAHTH